jgi:RNA 3'-terminal phosphate cyclase (ATP)
VQTVEIDGSYGEGGGQILRTAAAFAVILRRPIHVTKIRSGRRLPGLRQQHASALEILSQVSGGRLEGASVGSTEITFSPGDVTGGSFTFDLGTAASITLVLQAVIPAASLAGAPLSLELTGGTDVPWSPTYDYLASVVKEAFSRVGIKFSTESGKRGYYPRGGGKVRVGVEPCPFLSPLSMTDPPPRSSANLVSRCGRLPRHVAERQLDSAVSALKAKGITVTGSTVALEDSDSPGSSILIQLVEAGRVVGADAIGARGRRAEEVGADAAGRFASVCESQACVDSNLADMLAPVLALSSGASRLRIPEVTQHLETSLHIAKLFTGCEWSAKEDGHSMVLAISPRMHPRLA